MRLHSFQLFNLGPIKRVEILLDPRINVIAGINGAGKSTILHTLAMMMGRYSSAVRVGRVSGSLNREQIRKGAKTASVHATIVSDLENSAKETTWKVGVSRPGTKIKGITDSRELIDFAREAAQKVEKDPKKGSLPFAVFYSVNRSVLDVPLRIRKKIGFDQYVALEDALTQGSRSFRTFFSWFRDREDVENEMRAEGIRRRDPQLTAVRRAIHGMMPGFENLRVRRQPLRMLITKGGLDLRVDELSDGEKCLLAMVGDLARRLAIANPGMKDALNGSAIVLIDELELHLHPAWQRLAVRNLVNTFPNCQFIVSSHSPQILGEVEPNSLVLLNNGLMKRPSESFGRDTNLILKELMGATARPDWAVDDLANLYDLIDDEKFSKARRLLLKLENELGPRDPDLVAARIVLADI